MDWYFIAVNDKQLGICLRMLYAENIQGLVQTTKNSKDKIEFHISTNADEALFQVLVERYQIMIS